MAEGLESKKRKLDQQMTSSQLGWSDLPLIVLERIKSLLSQDDQSNMSLVCKQWATGFRPPSVWPNFRFVPISDADPCPRMKFVLVYSHKLKHVKIECHPIFCQKLLLKWHRKFKEFLQILKRTSQLYSVEFHGLKHFFKRMETPFYNSVCKEIADFLKSQRFLNRLEFYECKFKYNDCVELLKSSLENNVDSLNHLVLLEFVRFRNPVFQQDFADRKILHTIFGFRKLAFLMVDNWLIFGYGDTFLKDYFETLENCPTHTVLKEYSTTDEQIACKSFKLLTSSEWKLHKNMYSGLEVELNVGVSSMQRKLPEFSFVEHMPITHLNYLHLHIYFVHPFFVEIGSFLDYIFRGSNCHHLVSSDLRWELFISNVSTSFAPFLKTCKNLKQFTLSTVFPVHPLGEFLEVLLDSQSRRSLESITFRVCRANRKDKQMLMDLASKFKPRLKSANLDLLVEFY